MADFPRTDGGLREIALFAGAGGGILGGHLLGWRTVCAVEWEPYPASVLAARQNDGILPAFPIWDDVRTFDGRPWRGLVDVVSGGFPCQDISVAGKGAGITGERSGMWSHMARIVGEVRPRFVFVENSPALLTRGLGTVLSDLAALGYDCRWTVLGASDVGAPHRRERFWLVANAAGEQHEGAPHAEWREASAQLHPDADIHGMEERLWEDRKPCAGEVGESRDEVGRVCKAVARTDCIQRSGWRKPLPSSLQEIGLGRAEWWRAEPDVGGTSHGMAQGLDVSGFLENPWAAGWEDGTPRTASGVAARVDRLKAIGNGQVPRCAAEAWRLLTTQTKE